MVRIHANKAIPLIGIALFLAFNLHTSRAENARNESGALFGEVVDRKTGEGIGWVNLLIKDLNRTAVSHEDGSFHFFNVPSGSYRLETFHVGYENTSQTVTIDGQDTTRIQLKLMEAPFSGTEVTVIADRDSSNQSPLRRRDFEISGKQLRQSLGQTIAETIDDEPGLSKRTMGPAPARPVLRGLSGDRLLMLEDGERTGDLSGTSSDHAVVIEPMTAERIEVIRGPEALTYGSNTLAGVINVHRDYIPTHVPHRFNGTVSLQTQSVNSAQSVGFTLNAPLDAFAVHLDGSYRKGDDLYTPEGVLQNTDLQTMNGSVGISYVPKWGFIGVAGSGYDSKYGIPPDPFGGHPSGVDIELKRRHVESRLQYYPDADCFCHLDIKHTFTEYKHTEFESDGDVGIRFGVITQNLSTVMHLRNRGRFKNGRVGLWTSFRDYATSGASYTPRSYEYGAALYWYQEVHFGRFKTNGAFRYDLHQVDPTEEKQVDRVDFSLNIRDRTFRDFSAAFSALYQWNRSWSTGASFMRTFRAPGVEELFSEGPHLAAYAYEVGNSELMKETAVGTELFAEYKSTAGTRWRAAVFRNAISGYIFPKNTGRKSLRRADLFLYQYEGEAALMQGFETLLNWHINDHWSAYGSLSYTHGQLTERNEAIPRIPPLGGKAKISYHANRLTLGAHLRFGGQQNRLGKFENLFPVYDAQGAFKTDANGDVILEQRPTEAYTIFDLSADYYFSSGKFLHTVSLSMTNVSNKVYRKHLNRVKEIMPEPGRNIKLLYKLFF